MNKTTAIWLVFGILMIGWGEYFSKSPFFWGSLNLNTLVGYLGWLGLVIGLILWGGRSKHKILSNLSFSVAGLLFFWFLVEIICFLVIKLGVLQTSAPFHSRLLLYHNWYSDKRPFWGDYSKFSGRWRMPYDTLINVPCHGDTVIITTNSFGMRDRERDLKNNTSQKRVAMLGDSFLEGYIVNTPQRHSDLLETATQAEHLNFGLNGTSVINYYLTYKHLAKRFEHDVVTVAILPANDFEDYTSQQKISLMEYPIYRPYWEGDFPNVSLQYSLAHIGQSIASPPNHTRPRHTQQVVDSIYRSLPLIEQIRAEWHLNSYLNACLRHGVSQLTKSRIAQTGSFSKEFFESRWPAFEYSLEQLAKEAKGKKVFFYVIPILSDLEAYDKNRTDDLSPRLEKLCQKYNIMYINTLPIFHAKGREVWSKLYEPCDGHWTAAGEKMMAEILLSTPAYRRALELP
ncbi:MAG: hypothetical protein ACK4GN_09820 [Runella sp.]